MGLTTSLNKDSILSQIQFIVFLYFLSSSSLIFFSHLSWKPFCSNKLVSWIPFAIQRESVMSNTTTTSIQFPANLLIFQVENYELWVAQRKVIFRFKMCMKSWMMESRHWKWMPMMFKKLCTGIKGRNIEKIYSWFTVCGSYHTPKFTLLLPTFCLISFSYMESYHVSSCP